MTDVEDITVSILKNIQETLASHGTQLNELRSDVAALEGQLTGIRGVLGDQAVSLSILRSGQDRMLKAIVDLAEDHERRIRSLEERT